MTTWSKLGNIFSKAARGRPEGPTERSVFKLFLGMLANFWLTFGQTKLYKIRKIIVWSHATYGRKCEVTEASDGRKNNAGAELLGR